MPTAGGKDAVWDRASRLWGTGDMVLRGELAEDKEEK
jgi:hypothetical protein